MHQSNIVCETLIVLGTYKREQIAIQSINSLLRAIKSYDVKFVLSDASARPLIDKLDDKNKIDDYIWTPKFTSMATSRNLAHSLSIDKYCYEWIMFLEDDLLYDEEWYPQLMDFASSAYGRLSPLGLSYGAFSASPNSVKKDDTSEFDRFFDCYAGFFGLRADQRLYKSSLYSNFARFWDPDLLGISSCQTGKQSHRLTMNGFCAGSIGHKNLCRFVDGEESTWEGQRDIGPAAFDKRLTGHNSIINISRKNSVDPNSRKIRGKVIINSGSTQDYSVASYPVLPESINRPMTAKVPFYMLGPREIFRRFKKVLRVVLTGRG